MKKDCSTCLFKEGSCYPSKTIFDKDKTCKSYEPDYEGYIAELEEKLANADYQLEGRDLEIKELKAQIEKMQNCRNCKNEKIEGACGHFTQVGWCRDWELADQGDARK